MGKYFKLFAGRSRLFAGRAPRDLRLAAKYKPEISIITEITPDRMAAGVSIAVICDGLPLVVQFIVVVHYNGKVENRKMKDLVRAIAAASALMLVPAAGTMPPHSRCRA